jgi:hypothetical protein
LSYFSETVYLHTNVEALNVPVSEELQKKKHFPEKNYLWGKLKVGGPYFGWGN